MTELPFDLAALELVETRLPLPVLSAAGRSWRPLCDPLLVDGRATEAMCTRLDELERAYLDEHELTPTGRRWWTMQLVDGRIRGCWAERPEEAVTSMAFWFRTEVRWIVDDFHGKFNLWLKSQVPRAERKVDRHYPLVEPRELLPESLDAGGLW